MKDQIIFRCILCGDTITDKEYTDETLLAHLLRRHIEYIRAIALGLWEALDEDDPDA